MTKQSKKHFKSHYKTI